MLMSVIIENTRLVIRTPEDRRVWHFLPIDLVIEPDPLVDFWYLRSTSCLFGGH